MHKNKGVIKTNLKEIDRICEFVVVTDISASINFYGGKSTKG